MNGELLNSYLTTLGLSISANFIYDILKRSLSFENKSYKEELISKLASYLNVENANIVAEKIIEFLAEHGDIDIIDSEIYAKKAILLASYPNTSFSLVNSKSMTDNTGIIVNGSRIVGVNGAQIRQNEDGSISFRT